jgi:serine/threonine protein phosphatase PrpC
VTRLRHGSATDVGRVRQNNEDDLLVAAPLFAVADGMGGHAAGEVASAIAVQMLGERFDGDRTAGGLAQAVRAANRAVWEKAQEQPGLRGMGTTLTAVALVEDDGQEVLAVVNVGDSRAYRLQHGELEQLTEDHSLVEELVRSGRISLEEAHAHPQKHVLTRVLGVDPDVEVDCFRVVPYRGDRFLLASDGLFNEVDDRTIASVLRRVDDPNAAAAELVELAKDNGGSDNITAVIIDIVDATEQEKAAGRNQTAGRSPSVGLSRARSGEVPDGWREGEGPIGAGPPMGGGPPPTGPVRQRVTAKTAAFVVLVVLVLGAGFGTITWFGRSTYYVGLDGDRVTIFQGRPGGLLWYDPTVKRRTDLHAHEVRPARLDTLREGKQEPSLDDAERYVENLRSESARVP